MRKYFLLLLFLLPFAAIAQIPRGVVSQSQKFIVISIQSLESVDPITVDYGTSAGSLGLPATLDAVINNGTTAALTVTWNTSNYNGNVADDYTIFGSLTLPPGVRNTKSILPTAVVTVSSEVRTIASAAAQDDVTVFTEVPFASLDLPTTVEVTLDNASTADLEVTWDEGTYNENVPDTYTLDGTLTLTGPITNPGNVEAHIDVIVVSPPEVTVSSVASITPITVAYNTPFGSLTLPSAVNTTLSNSDIVSINLSWAQGVYDQDAPDTYTLNGTLTPLPEDVTNPGNVQAHIDVTVLPQGGEEDGVQVKKVIGTNGSPLGYLQYLPDDYSLTDDLYPIFIYLHGAGAKGNGGSTDLDKVSSEQVPKNIKNGWNAIVNGQKMIVLSPQTSQQSELAWVNVAPAWLDWLFASGLRYDPDRVYIGGWSMGACGAIKIGASAWNTPNKFAGMISGAHSAGSYADALALAGKGMPIWFFNGTNDSSVPCCQSGTACTECYRENTGGRVPYYYDTTGGGDLTKENVSSGGGVSSIGSSATFSIWTVFNLGTHSSTADMAFRVNHNDHNPNAFEWLLTKSL